MTAIRPPASAGPVAGGGAFRWHPDARLFDGRGREQTRTVPGLCLPPPDPPCAALASVLAHQGPFRIGGIGPAPEPDAEPVFETLTSGSLGNPRRIRRRQGSWCASFAVNAGLFAIGPGTRVATLGALVQSLSLYAAAEALHLGAEAHLLVGLRPDQQRQALAGRGIQVLYASPAQMRLLVAAKAPELASLREIILGGAKLDQALREGLHRLAPYARVTEFYGTAETSFLAIADAQTPDHAVGRSYPGVDLSVRGAEGGEVADGQPGEIWARSPYLFDAYAGDPGSARWQDGWLSVGEMGCMTGGQLTVLGRIGRMVTVADQNVFPEEIEAFLLRCPGVVQSAVLHEPDATRGHRLVAILSGDQAQEEAILSSCRAELGSTRSPRRIVWRANWPMLPSGKTDLRALQGDLR